MGGRRDCCGARRSLSLSLSLSSWIVGASTVAPPMRTFRFVLASGPGTWRAPAAASKTSPGAPPMGQERGVLIVS
eukprot:COSAG06_NODE_2623_length_6562_cov_9.546031_4_plen_75_part_00